MKTITEQPKQTRDLKKFPLPSMYYKYLYENSLKIRENLVQIVKYISSQFRGSQFVIPPLKGFERTVEKVTNYHKGDWSAIIDVVRGSISFQNMHDLEKGLIEFYKKIPIVYILDTFDKPYDTGYRDIFVIFKDPTTGILGELQFHLCHILNVLKKAHPLYEISRTLEETASIQQRPLTPDEKKQLDDLLQKQNDIFNKAVKASQEEEPCLYKQPTHDASSGG